MQVCDDDFEDELPCDMSCNHPLEWILCTYALRGDAPMCCAIITMSLVSSNCRDCFDVNELESFLESSNLLSYSQLQKLVCFSDERLSFLEEYTINLMTSKAQLKAKASVNPGNPEAVGDVLNRISQMSWINSVPRRCSKGANCSAIVVAANETIRCINEIRKLRNFIKSAEFQQKLTNYILENWSTTKMCYSNCASCTLYRTQETVY